MQIFPILNTLRDALRGKASKAIMTACIFAIALTQVGCKDTLEQLTGMTQEERPDEAYQAKLIEDLKAFDQIRTQQNSLFMQLDDQLDLASSKQTTNSKVRQELRDLAGTLDSQNQQFKQLHVHTPEVARLRNAVMQLNYSTMQIVALVDNPNAVNSRLDRYKSMQKNYLNRYNHLRTEVESKLAS